MKKIIVLLTIALFTIAHPVYAEEKVSVATATLSAVDAEATKTADVRVMKLQKYLESVGSTMAGDAEHFVSEADRLGLDWKLVAAIAGNESYFGKLIPYNSYNAWGWAVWTGTNYGANFENWKDGITTVSEGLKENYVDDGLTTVEQIGERYAADPQWSQKVNHFLADIDAYETDEVELFDLVL